ncbi:MAG TPA: SDR family oxidoreductase [Pseudomonadota bacterium]|nr:SDR family oxidoreductase [Pseudomonadota bacterium]
MDSKPMPPRRTPRATPVFQPDLMQGQVILVTGGGSGLGLTMSAALCDVGAQVVICGRNPDRLGKAAETLRARGGRAMSLSCDVRNPEQVDELVRKASEACGKIDGLINNAAGNFLCAAEDLSPGGFDAVVKTVLYGSVYATQAVGRHLIARKAAGSVLSILTPYAWTGSAFVLPSACAKAGVLAMTRSLAVEWGVYGIRLNAIAPGPFPTEGAWSRLVPEGAMVEDLVTNRVPMGRVGEHSELGHLAVFLLSDASPYQNGDCVTIDGGSWLSGAGEFSEYTRYDRDRLKVIFQAMRPKKGDGGGSK